MAHCSFSRQVLDAANTLLTVRNEVSTDDISKELNIQTRRDHKRLIWVLSNLKQAGRLSWIRQGVYGARLQAKPDKREWMWRVLRMRRRIQLDDLVEMTGVNRDYAKQWLRLLVKHGIAFKQQEPGMKGTWHLMNDLAECPVDTDKAVRLRKLRQEKKGGQAKTRSM